MCAQMCVQMCGRCEERAWKGCGRGTEGRGRCVEGAMGGTGREIQGSGCRAKAEVTPSNFFPASTWLTGGLVMVSSCSLHSVIHLMPSSTRKLIIFKMPQLNPKCVISNDLNCNVFLMAGLISEVWLPMTGIQYLHHSVIPSKILQDALYSNDGDTS